MGPPGYPSTPPGVVIIPDRLREPEKCIENADLKRIKDPGGQQGKQAEVLIGIRSMEDFGRHAQKIETAVQGGKEEEPAQHAQGEFLGQTM